MDDLRNILLCSECDCILNSPVFLPCLERICKNHVEDLINKDLKVLNCKYCNNEHPIPIEGFKEDKKTAKLIELKVHQMDLGNAHKTANDSCIKLDITIQDLERLTKDTDCYLNEYFDKLINQIDIRKEENILIIKKWHKACFEEIQRNKKDCLIIFKKKFDKQNELVRRAKEQLDLWKRKLVIPELSKDEFSFLKIDENAESFQMILSKSLDILKGDILLNTEYKLEKKTNIHQNYFGQILQIKKVF